MRRRATAQSVGRVAWSVYTAARDKIEIRIEKESSASLVKIVDSIMGSGKTTWYMEYVNRYPEQKYIIVVPYIEECNRILEKCGEMGFVQPEAEYMPSKSASFHELLRTRHSIVMCHALFACLKLTEDEIALIGQERYTLIIDETPQ